MKEKVIFSFCLIYLASFSNFVFSLIGLSLNSFVLLFLDLGIIYLGLSSLKYDHLSIWVGAILVSISFLNFLYNQYSLIIYLNGLREILILILIFPFYEALSKTPYRMLFRKWFHIYSIVFLSLQIPVTIYQFMLYGAGDEVGGTLGFGYSGTLTLVTIPMVFLLIKTEQSRIGLRAFSYSIFLIPLFLNETKISFILIPLMFLLLIDFKKKSTILVSAVGAVLLFVSLNTFYSNEGKKLDNPFQEMFNKEYVESYLLGEARGESGVPRISKIVKTVNMLNENIGYFLLGRETGAFKGGSVVSKSKFSQEYDWLLVGSRAYVFYLLVSGGWLMLVTVLGFFLNKLCFGFRSKGDIKLISLLFSIFIIILFYSDAFRTPLFLLVYVYYIYRGKGYFTFIYRRKANDVVPTQARKLNLINNSNFKINGSTSRF